MIKNQVIRIIGLIALISGTAGAVEYTPERYDVIVSRSPFGSEELGGSAADSPQNDAAVKAAANELRLCFLFETDQGEARAGFENKTAKAGTAKSITLMLGEDFRGMKVLDIDLARGRVTMDRSGNEVVFELKKEAAPKKPATAAQAKPAVPQRRFGGGFKRDVSAVPPAQSQPTQAELLKQAEVQRTLQEYQMEVIRKGQPPLPIPLTPEMDDQLVAEGVLPPQ